MNEFVVYFDSSDIIRCILCQLWYMYIDKPGVRASFWAPRLVPRDTCQLCLACLWMSLWFINTSDIIRCILCQLWYIY
uniref:Putative ovule protein n=1 Tax=Solanum chacoense TaxID=4108 RepID=A0A0V0GLJ1_SOLCH